MGQREIKPRRKRREEQERPETAMFNSYSFQVVAAKVFDSDVFRGSNFSEFYRRELESLLRLRHPNVLKLVSDCDVKRRGAVEK